jgi:hypothetical protein
MRIRRGILPGAAVLLLAACQDSTSAAERFSTTALSGALVSPAAGYGDLASSYVGAAAAEVTGDSAGWIGGGRERCMGGGDLMGGGLDGAFLGGIGFGNGRGHRGPFGGGLPCAGTFSATTGRVTCETSTGRNGLTVARSAQYTSAQGAVQQAFDTLTTNTVNLRSAVSGTIAFAARDTGAADGGRPHGPGGPGGRGPRGGDFGRLLGDTARILSATTVVSDASDRTVSGLAQGSAQRTVSGTSQGTETTTGTSSRGSFTATRTTADTTSGIVVPVVTAATGPTFPTAGSVVRVMKATLSYTGASPVSVSRREVVTYDGSATAKVVITENGTTKSCTRALPRGALVCQ